MPALYEALLYERSRGFVHNFDPLSIPCPQERAPTDESVHWGSSPP